MSDSTALVVALLLLAGNAFFVGAEFALVSARRTQIEPAVEEGSTAARLALRGMDNVSLMMAGAQLGITMCSLGLGAVGEPAVAHLLEPVFELLGIPSALLHLVSLVVALAIVVTLHMVLGEMVPKNVVLAGPRRAALLFGPPLYAVVTVFKPVVALLNGIANLSLRVVRVQPQDEVTSAFTAEDVAAFVSESRREGLLDETEHELLTGALSFDEGRVRDVVLDAGTLQSVRPDATVGELESMCAETGYSRFPVHSDGADFLGYVHVKDLLAVPAEDRDQPLRQFGTRPFATVSADQSLRDALAVMQARNAHMARVREPDGGGFAGVVTLEDVLEELVGQMVDSGQDVTG